MSKAAAIYIRTGHACSESVTHQKEATKQYAKAVSEADIKEYIDNGFSGISMNRPGFNKLNADIERGLVGKVIVKNISRISRNHLEYLIWLEECQRNGVTVISL